jgi:hypothetical protein
MKSICNFAYAKAKKGGGHFPDVRGLLKYITHRDDRDDRIPGGGGPDRWVDGGLGDSYPKILARLDELSAGDPHAYCFAVVISPDPEAVATWRTRQAVEGDPHARFVEAIRADISEWGAWRDLYPIFTVSPRAAVRSCHANGPQAFCRQPVALRRDEDILPTSPTTPLFPGAGSYLFLFVRCADLLAFPFLLVSIVSIAMCRPSWKSWARPSPIRNTTGNQPTADRMMSGQ